MGSLPYAKEMEPQNRKRIEVSFLIKCSNEESLGIFLLGFRDHGSGNRLKAQADN